MNNEYNSNLHIMVDLETLDTKSSAVVQQISAIQFNPFTGEMFKMFDAKLNIQQMINAGHTISESTLRFWLNQSKEVIDEVFSEELVREPMIALYDFAKFIESCSESKYNDRIDGSSMLKVKDVKLWGNGPTFDLTKLKSLYQTFHQIEAPWAYYNERCMRTISAFDPQIKKAHQFDGNAHNALADCQNQIAIVSKNLQQMQMISQLQANQIELDKFYGESNSR